MGETSLLDSQVPEARKSGGFRHSLIKVSQNSLSVYDLALLLPRVGFCSRGLTCLTGPWQISPWCCPYLDSFPIIPKSSRRAGSPWFALSHREAGAPRGPYLHGSCKHFQCSASGLSLYPEPMCLGAALHQSARELEEHPSFLALGLGLEQCWGALYSVSSRSSARPNHRCPRRQVPCP